MHDSRVIGRPPRITPRACGIRSVVRGASSRAAFPLGESLETAERERERERESARVKSRGEAMAREIDETRRVERQSGVRLFAFCFFSANCDRDRLTKAR